MAGGWRSWRNYHNEGYEIMSIGPITNNFSILDASNNQLIRSTSAVSTGTASKELELDLIVPLASPLLPVPLADLGFSNPIELLIHNTGADFLTFGDDDPGSFVVIPAGQIAFIPYVGVGNLYFTASGQDGSCYLLGLELPA